MVTKKRTKDRKPSQPGRIKVSPHGPYLVSGGIPLVTLTPGTDAEGYPCGWRMGKQYLPQENYALCRCGRSKNKPFCDGTHAQIRFDGTETASREPYLDRAEQIVGPDLDLTDARPLCVGASFCDRAGGIWDLTRRSDDPQARQTAIEEASDCPSGRLVVWDKHGQAIEPEFEPSIGVVEDSAQGTHGPLWVRGGIPIESADGTVNEVRNRVTLCRCGKSTNMPFCDGSHVYE